jgi:hypothetical protein
MMAYIIAAETLMGSDEFIAKMKQAIKSAIPDYSEIEQLRVQQGEIEQGLKKIKIAKNRLLDLAERGALKEGDRAGVYIRKDNEAEWSFTIKGIFSGIDERDFLPMEPWKANALLGIEDDNYNPFEKRELKSPNSGLKPLPLC